MQRWRDFVVALMACLVIAAGTQATERPLRDGPALTRHVLQLVDARLALMPDVAAAKWIAHQPVADPAREALVIQAVGEQALGRGLARGPVESLFAAQIRRARELQTDLIEQWERTHAGPTSAPSLQQDLRPAIDTLTTELLSALSLAAPFLATVDLDSLTGELPSTRWRPADRQGLAEALRAIRFDAPRSPQRTRQSGTLRIGLPGDYAPFAWVADGHLTGADIELTEKIASDLGLEPVYVQSSWATLLEDLAADRFDIAAGGISINDKRRLSAGFSVPLTTGGKTAIGRCSDRARFQSVEQIDQPSTRVIENPGGTNEAFARRHLQRAQLRIHHDNVSVFAEITAHRADVMYTDDIEISRLVHRDPELCRLLPDIFEPADKALLLPRSEDWTTLINSIVAPEITSGRYATWLERAISQ